jgi:phosphate transport system substrate-binding protein
MGEDLPVKLYGRNSVSGTHAMFKSRALCGGDFKSLIHEMNGSGVLVQAIARDRTALGYAAFGVKQADVKLLSVGLQPDNLVPATAQSIASGEYPLSRYLYLMVNKPPDKPLSRNLYEFTRFVLSVQGQEIATGDGYVAVPDTMVNKQLANLRRSVQLQSNISF